MTINIWVANFNEGATFIMDKKKYTWFDESLVAFTSAYTSDNSTN